MFLLSPPPHEFSFTLPLHPLLNSEHTATPADDIFLHGHLLPPSNLGAPLDRVKEKERTMPSALSAFLGLENWRKRSRTTVEDKNKNKKSFDAAQFLKKYASMVEPLFFLFKKDKESKRGVTRWPYSFSGHSGYVFAKEKWKKKRTAQVSAPASARTSPANSGRLAGTPTVSFSSSDKSSMEELQSAIQAAIAHCKNSIAEKGCREV